MYSTYDWNQTEGKAKVGAVGWGTELKAALDIQRKDNLMKRMNRCRAGNSLI